VTDSSVSALLKKATRQLELHSDSARLDAEVLLCRVLNKPREYLYTWPEAETTAEQQSNYQSFIARRTEGIPLAYLTGVKEFWSHTFNVTPDTLVPRPETELIVELSLVKLKDNGTSYLDLGTGSGAIAISVAKELPGLKVLATDISTQALAVAQFNATQLSANVEFLQSDWLEQVPDQAFSVIAANPPYIAADDPHLKTGGLPFEPISALRSCENGFADITAIINSASDYLTEGGWLLIEHGSTQGKQTRDLMQDNYFGQVETKLDLFQKDRVTLGQKV